MNWGVLQLRDELERLLEPGVIGFYESFDVVEIIGFKGKNKQPINGLSLLVAEAGEAPEGTASKPCFLNTERIEVKGTEWKFGVLRYRVSTQSVLDAVTRYASDGVWRLETSAISVGALTPIIPQFVHPDSYEPHPWNNVLKNNFWEGSHVLELFDTRKADLLFLTEESSLLVELAKAVRSFIPIDIDGLSDRLGNVVIQLPVTVISTAMKGSSVGDQQVHIEWHPRAVARPLRVSSEIYGDATTDAYDTKNVSSVRASLRLRSPGGGARTIIWDEAHGVILSSSPVQTFLTAIGVSVHAHGPGDDARNSRTFTIPISCDEISQESVVLQGSSEYRYIGSVIDRPRDRWKDERIFKLSARALQESREFVQYGHLGESDRLRALGDLRWLLEKHGKQGAWLWDPFLTSQDLLQTLFFNPHNGADLRALTEGDEPKKERACNRESSTQAEAAGVEPKSVKAPPLTRLQAWKVSQQEQLAEHSGNRLGLKLEYRLRSGGAGWPFHDRFLIFPRNEGPAQVWSLGTSVNSLGSSHHILQKVSNGELILNAFLSLWNCLSGDEHLVWKS